MKQLARRDVQQIKSYGRIRRALDVGSSYEIDEFRRPNLPLPRRGYIRNTLEMLVKLSNVSKLHIFAEIIHSKHRRFVVSVCRGGD